MNIDALIHAPHDCGERARAAWQTHGDEYAAAAERYAVTLALVAAFARAVLLDLLDPSPDTLDADTFRQDAAYWRGYRAPDPAAAADALAACLDERAGK